MTCGFDKDFARIMAVKLHLCCALCALSSTQGCVRTPTAKSLLATHGQANNITAQDLQVCPCIDQSAYICLEAGADVGNYSAKSGLTAPESLRSDCIHGTAL